MGRVDFDLKVCRGGKIETITNPSPEMIEQTIDDLIPVRDHFVILESTPQLNDCVWIQTIIEWDDKPLINYSVEAHFKHGKKLAYYRRFTTDAEWLKKLFRMFALEVIPDIEGWEDVTNEVIAAIKKSKAEKNRQRKK